MNAAKNAWIQMINTGTVDPEKDFASSYRAQHFAFVQALVIALPRAKHDRAGSIATYIMHILYADIKSRELSGLHGSLKARIQHLVDTEFQPGKVTNSTGMGEGFLSGWIRIPTPTTQV